MQQGSWTLALVSSRRNRGSRAQTPIFTIENQDFLVQMAQAQPGLAQAGPGPAFGNLGTWKSRNLGSKNIKKNTSSQNPNPVCPKCRQGLDSPEKKPPGPIWGHPRQFFAWAGKIAKMQNFCLFSLVGPWALFSRFGVMCWCHLNFNSSHSFVGFQ